MHELYYVEDEELDFDAILNKPLPKVPLDVTFTGEDSEFGLEIEGPSFSWRMILKTCYYLL